MIRSHHTTRLHGTLVAVSTDRQSTGRVRCVDCVVCVRTDLACWLNSRSNCSLVVGSRRSQGQPARRSGQHDIRLSVCDASSVQSLGGRATVDHGRRLRLYACDGNARRLPAHSYKAYWAVLCCACMRANRIKPICMWTSPS